eukprot:gene12649-biopygen11189
MYGSQLCFRRSELAPVAKIALAAELGGIFGSGGIIRRQGWRRRQSWQHEWRWRKRWRWRHDPAAESGAMAASSALAAELAAAMARRNDTRGAAARVIEADRVAQREAHQQRMEQRRQQGGAARKAAALADDHADGEHAVAVSQNLKPPVPVSPKSSAPSLAHVATPMEKLSDAQKRSLAILEEAGK